MMIVLMLVIGLISDDPWGIPQENIVLNYNQGYTQAKKENKGLITFIGIAPRAINNQYLVCQANHLPGYPKECIIVADSQLQWLRTLPITATDNQIIGSEVQPLSAVPFQSC